MKLTKEAEIAFRRKYKVCASNLNKYLMEDCETIIEAIKEHGDMVSFTEIEHFEDFAIEAILNRAAKQIELHKGQHEALQQAKDILEDSNEKDPQ
jgi:hypothetical protein